MICLSKNEVTVRVNIDALLGASLKSKFSNDSKLIISACGSTFHWMGHMLICHASVTGYQSETECRLAS